MSRSVEFQPEAEAEIESAALWYEQQRPDLGLQFLLALDAALSRVVATPCAFPRAARRTRRVFLRRFPYIVFYLVEEERVIVTGLFHGHRGPECWSDRIEEQLLRFGLADSEHSRIPGAQFVCHPDLLMELTTDSAGHRSPATR